LGIFFFFFGYILLYYYYSLKEVLLYILLLFLREGCRVAGLRTIEVYKVAGLHRMRKEIFQYRVCFEKILQLLQPDSPCFFGMFKGRKTVALLQTYFFPDFATLQPFQKRIKNDYILTKPKLHTGTYSNCM